MTKGERAGLAIAGGVLVFVATPLLALTMSWNEDMAYWLVVWVPLIALTSTVLWWSVRAGRSIAQARRSLSAWIHLGIVGGLAWSGALVGGPALAETLGRQTEMISGWRENSAQGFLLVGATYAALAIWGALCEPRVLSTTSRAARTTWLVTTLAVHVVVVAFVLGRIAPNETAAAFASVYEIPFAALLLALEVKWRRLLRREETTP